MAENDPKRWFEILEVLVRKWPDEAEAEWKWLMQQLRLGPEYFIAVYEAIQEGRWRTAENPGAYIKTVAKRHGSSERREARRTGRLGGEAEEPVNSGGVEADGERPSIEGSLEYMQHRQESREPMKSGDGVWRSAPELSGIDGVRFVRSRRRPGLEKELSGPLARFAKKAAEIEKKRQAENPDDLYIDAEPEKLPDWNIWAEAAGLSEWEKKVAFYKVSHIGREEALKQQPDEESRRALQAAWKRFERTALERLRAAAREEDEV